MTDTPKIEVHFEESYLAKVEADAVRCALTAQPQFDNQAETIAEFAKVIDYPIEQYWWAENPIVGGLALRFILAGHEFPRVFEPCGDKQVPITYDDLRALKRDNPKLYRKFEKTKLNAEGSCLDHALWGCYETSWVTWLWLYRDHIDVSKLRAYKHIISGASLIWVKDHKAVFSMIPTVERNKEGLPHCATGPAYCGQFYLHGLWLPKEHTCFVTDPTSRSREAFDKVANAQLRAAIIATWPENYLEAEKPFASDRFGDLYRVFMDRDTGGSGGRLMNKGEHAYSVVRVVCPSTNAVYWLRVPPEHRTAHAAVAATYGLTPEQYDPELRT